MDAFYASVEQRDDPQLRGKPVIVAWLGNRSVVCAASYEARSFGVHSAMPAKRAERLCPDAVIVPPDFTRYRQVSRSVREIFKRHTDLIEPLSQDEAYLNVTENKTGLATATLVARTIRQQIREELSLTASAGVAPNKFLAKLASDWRKPVAGWTLAWRGQSYGREACDTWSTDGERPTDSQLARARTALRPLWSAPARACLRYRP
jgi:DNA polymerase-4